VRRSATAPRSVVGAVTLRPDRMRSAASGLLMATDVADYLTARGVPFRHAHEIVGSMVRQLLAAGPDFDSFSAQEWRDFSDKFGDDVGQAIRPESSIRARKTPQSTAPDAVRAQLAETRRWLGA